MGIRCRAGTETPFSFGATRLTATKRITTGANLAEPRRRGRISKRRRPFAVTRRTLGGCSTRSGTFGKDGRPVRGLFRRRPRGSDGAARRNAPRQPGRELVQRRRKLPPRLSGFQRPGGSGRRSRLASRFSSRGKLTRNQIAASRFRLPEFYFSERPFENVLRFFVFFFRRGGRFLRRGGDGGRSTATRRQNRRIVRDFLF